MTALRIVSWNCSMALHRKVDALLALRPDVAIVPECGQEPELGDGELVRVAWTGAWDSKGLAVYARPDLEATLDGSFDPALRWFLPIWVRGAPHDGKIVGDRPGVRGIETVIGARRQAERRHPEAPRVRDSPRGALPL